MYKGWPSILLVMPNMHDVVGPFFRLPLTCPGGLPPDVGPYKKGFDNM